MELLSRSADETISFAWRLGKVVAPGDVICLDGSLGAGKTTFIGGLARGLGHEGPIRSPTFTIVHCYESIRLCHIDAYRLSCAREFFETGLLEFFDGNWVCAIEWSEKVRDALPEKRLLVMIEFGENTDERKLTIEALGDWDGRYESLFEEVRR